MILEVVTLRLKPGSEAAYEQALREAARDYLAQAKGYVRHELHRSHETPRKYLLFIYWDSIEDHTVGFRQSELYLGWREKLHPFYDGALEVEHYHMVNLS
jgi:heme-degrading monooxygenase HmoA